MPGAAYGFVLAAFAGPTQPVLMLKKTIGNPWIAWTVAGLALAGGVVAAAGQAAQTSGREKDAAHSRAMEAPCRLISRTTSPKPWG